MLSSGAPEQRALEEPFETEPSEAPWCIMHGMSSLVRPTQGWCPRASKALDLVSHPSHKFGRNWSIPSYT